ncbi:GXWXG domain-containing protein, partial [Nocardia sp. NPDC058497]|uniref:GXWXG domain-containing protein n=1 Tax=Nocardia sp. NPDC058497 TaxID=3346529 RepID=UPI00365368E2
MTAIAQLTLLEPACGRDAALALFDSLPPVQATELTGRWHGRELATGHPLDGLLAASGWYGKQFDGLDSVHPLLFRDP